MKTSTNKCWRILLAVLLIGCSNGDQREENTSSKKSIDGTKFLLAEEPGDATNVIAVRENAKDQDEVIIVGRIGGSADPWVNGRAAFSIVDLSLKSCKECGSHDCPKPWDYC